MSSTPAPPWLLPLQTALDAEFGARPRIAALASVDEAGGPQVRHVVIRRVEQVGRIWIASDARSEKNHQLRQTPRAALSLWLPTLREQYRLSGPVQVIGPADNDTRRLALWTNMSDAAQGLFAWPPPGTPRDPADDEGGYPAAFPVGATPPDAFELLLIDPDIVEHLDLNPHPHARHRWEADDGWNRRLLNP